MKWLQVSQSCVTKGGRVAASLRRPQLVSESMTDTEIIDNIPKRPIPLIPGAFLWNALGRFEAPELNYCTLCLGMNSSGFNFSGGAR